MNTKNSEEILPKCINIIKNFEPLKIILFGSRARGTERKDSDIDLMIIKESIKDRSAETIELYRALWKHRVYPDIVLVTREHFETWKDTTNHICNEVTLDGKVLYEKAA